MLKLAFRNIVRHRSRTALTLTVIVFGVCGLILSGGFVEDIFFQLREATIHSRLGHIQIYKSGFYATGGRDPHQYLITNARPVTTVAGSNEHVLGTLLRLQFSGLASTGRGDLPIIGEGVEPAKENRLGTFMTILEGRELTDADDFGILIGEGVAGALKVAPGQYLTLLANTPDGALNSLDFEIVGVFRTFSKDYDDRAVRVPLIAAQELLVTPSVHSIVVELDDTKMTSRVAEQLRAALVPQGFEVYTWLTLADFYRQTVQLFRRQFGVLQAIILIMVLLSVTNSVNIAVFERTGEFGTLMALGDRGRDIVRLVLVEHMVLGVVGATLGLLVGLGLAWILSKLGIPMPPPPNSNSGYIALIRIVPHVVVGAFLTGAIATSLASVVPARRAARLPIVDALRFNI